MLKPQGRSLILTSLPFMEEPYITPTLLILQLLLVSILAPFPSHSQVFQFSKRSLEESSQLVGRKTCSCIIQLIKSVLQSMLIYSITIYSLPVSLLKNMDSMFRNFSWTGDLNGKKLVIVSWKIICTPIFYGGLGLRSLTHLNKASNLKLYLELFYSNNEWAIFLRSRVLKGKSHIRYHIYSSIQSSIKSHFNTILHNSKWRIGNVNHVNFWSDK